MRNRATTPLKVKKDLLDQLRIRQSWSKYNLYNLSRLRPTGYKGRNFFQLKWTAKSVARNYHGEQVRESQWARMFDTRLRSVVPMDARYLASNDGTLESAGRGSGLETRDPTRRKPKADQAIPYMQMTFAPLERRLDTAIFRALFASSARQARQFVIHGAVTVNGKEMRYPGYLLNPGDMFQVLPERVMFATGAPKASTKLKAANEDADGEENAAEEKEGDGADEEVVEDQASDEADAERDPREVLKDLKAQAKTILTSTKRDLGAKRKQDLRAFSKTIQRLLSRSKSSTILTDSIEAQFAEIQHQLKIRRENQEAGTTSLPSAQDDTAEGEETSTPAEKAEASAEPGQEDNSLTDGEYNELLAALRSMHENPVDDSKPYATPWMPRDYMSAFAFIPRYLEVNHKICAAVYLRHPVARPGLAEVPSPFSEITQATAFGWYLRRR